MALNCEASSPIQLKFELHWDFTPDLVPSKFEEDLTESSSFFSTTHGHIIQKWLIRSGRNSNLSENLCLSSLLVSFMETEFRVTEKRWIHHFLHYKSMGKKIQCLRANNSKVSNPIRCTGLSWSLGSLTPGGQDTHGLLDPRGLKFPFLGYLHPRPDYLHPRGWRYRGLGVLTPTQF